LLIYDGSHKDGMLFTDENTGKKIFLNTKTGDLVTVVNESRNRGILSEINVRDAYQRFYTNIPLDTYNHIVSYIQDNNNVLLADTKWVLKCYAKNPQDTMRLVPLLHYEYNRGYLDIYNRLKAIHRIEESDRDITKFSNLRDFTNFVQKKMNELGDEEIWGDNTHRKKVNMDDKQKSAKNDIKKFYEDDEWLVISPNSYEASCYWGDNTEWCTAYKDDDSYYESYTQDGPLYININKQTKEKYQFHFESNSFMNQWDCEIDTPILDNMYGATEGLKNFYKKLSTEINQPEIYLTLTFSENEYGRPYDVFNFGDRWVYYHSGNQDLKELDFAASMGDWEFIDGFYSNDPYDELCFVRGKDGKFNFINGEGELITRSWFDDFGSWDTNWGTLPIKRNGKWNVLTNRGRDLFQQTDFDNIQEMDYDDDYYIGRIGDQEFILGKDGHFERMNNEEEYDEY
jgi:hypothetical protein